MGIGSVGIWENAMRVGSVVGVGVRGCIRRREEEGRSWLQGHIRRWRLGCWRLSERGKAEEKRRIMLVWRN